MRPSPAASLRNHDGPGGGCSSSSFRGPPCGIRVPQHHGGRRPKSPRRGFFSRYRTPTAALFPPETSLRIRLRKPDAALSRRWTRAAVEAVLRRFGRSPPYFKRGRICPVAVDPALPLTPSNAKPMLSNEARLRTCSTRSATSSATTTRCCRRRAWPRSRRWARRFRAKRELPGQLAAYATTMTGDADSNPIPNIITTGAVRRRRRPHVRVQRGSVRGR